MSRIILACVAAVLLAGCVYEPAPAPYPYAYAPGYYAAPGYYPGYYYGPPVYGSVYVRGHWR